MKTELKELIDLTVDYHNWLAQEFGENSYYNDKMCRVLKKLGVSSIEFCNDSNHGFEGTIVNYTTNEDKA